jgi:hypothetical protein
MKMADVLKFLEAVKKIVRMEFKNLTPPFSFARAKVVKSYNVDGKAFADIQILKLDGGDDKDFPIIPGLELPKASVELPAAGSQLRIGFYYFDASQPFIDALL